MPSGCPSLAEDVRRIIVDGAVGRVAGFNQGQAARNELRKISFLAEHPELETVVFRLEDHSVLRGALGAFELEPTTLTARTEAFWSLFDAEKHLFSSHRRCTRHRRLLAQAEPERLPVRLTRADELVA